MSRTLQGVIIGTVEALAVSGLLAMAVAWGPKHECALQFPKIVGCAIASYEGLAGGLIAVAGAIFAAWLAWVAVQAQISATEQLARRREDSSYQVIRSEMSGLIGLLVQVWRVVDRALSESNHEVERNGIALIKAMWPGAKALLEQLAGVETISADLDPEQRAEFSEAMAYLKSLFRFVDEELRNKSARENRASLDSLRAYLSHFERALMTFDPVAAAKFDARQKLPIDTRSTGEQLESMIQEFEQNGKA
jgi:hypothetical protein